MRESASEAARATEQPPRINDSRDQALAGPVRAAATAPTRAERGMAAVAHLLTLFSVPGMALTLVILLTQRHRSPYVTRQARAALLWQVLAHVVLLVALVVLLVGAFLSLGGAINTHGTHDAGSILGLFGSLVGLYLVLIAAALFFVTSSLVGAFQALRGRDHHYLGQRRPHH